MDLQQVVLNGGPPCFYVEGPQFCGRAERWPGHGNAAFHDFVSLESTLNERDQLLAEVARLAAERDLLRQRVHTVASMLKEAAFTLHVDADHGPAFAKCANVICSQACYTWNTLNEGEESK